MRSILIVILFISPLYLQAQCIDSFNIGKNIIELSPFNLIDPYIPNIELSFGRRLNKKFTIELSAASIFDGDLKYKPKPEWNLAPYGLNLEVMKYKIKGGVRYYLRTQKIKNAVFAHYVAFEIGFLHNYYYTPKYFFENNTYQQQFLDTIIIQQRTTAFNMKNGYEILYKNYMLEFFIGIGVKYHSVKFVGKKIPDSIDTTWHLSIFEPDDSERKDWGLNATCNLKIGICF